MIPLDKISLLKKRNHLLLILLTTFYLLDVVTLILTGNDWDMVFPPVGVGVLAILAFISYVLKPSPQIIRWSYIFAYYAYMTYLLIEFPYLINYLFLIFGIIIATIYHDYVSIVVSGIICILLLSFFYFYNMEEIFSEVVATDVIFFILFSVLCLIFLLFYTRYANHLWRTAYQNEQATKKELHTTQGYLQSFFQNNNDAMSIVDLDDHVIMINPAFEQIYGWSEAEILGKKLPVTGNKSIEHLENVKKVLESGQNIIGYQTQDIRKDGTLIDVEINISPIYDDHGKLMAFTHIVHDLSEQKTLDVMLRRSDKLALAGELAATVAHEVRNPLTSLNGFVQLIHEQSHEFEPYTSIMMDEIHRINEILEEFLSLAKPNREKFALHTLDHLLKGALHLFEKECESKGIVIQYNEADFHITIMCDSNQLKQVFINLFKNAVEAMPNGGILRLSASHDQDEVDIKIEDTGIGIPRSLLNNLYKPFVTSKESGTGLGLVVTQRIIHSHHGELTIDSVENSGTTIRISLPLSYHKIFSP